VEGATGLWEIKCLTPFSGPELAGSDLYLFILVNLRLVVTPLGVRFRGLVP
jgi:hypothetical protein